MAPRVGQKLGLPFLCLFVRLARDHLEHGSLPEVSHGAGPAYTNHQTASGRQTQIAQFPMGPLLHHFHGMKPARLD